MTEPQYLASSQRYQTMAYRRCGASGLLLPVVSLGLWHNFGGVDRFVDSRGMVLSAFDLGITHFDLANNYGPPPGSAEETFGRLMRRDLRPYRDEMIITSKAGWRMWPGPYGDLGSRKYLIASCDQSLRRMKVDYVDIFYSHRPDPDTPLAETMGALDQIVRSGKALYAGISSYSPAETEAAVVLLKDMGTPFVVHQPAYNMFDRSIEVGLLDTLAQRGLGCVVFSPLAQGLLTDKYLHGIPPESRAGKATGFLQSSDVTEARVAKVRKLREVALGRGQTMAQLALSWVLRDPRITSVIIGASQLRHITDAVGILDQLDFAEDELQAIEDILQG